MVIKDNFLDKLHLDVKGDDFTAIADQPIRYKGDVNPAEHPVVVRASEEVTAKMAGRGRVLLRKSGTEPLVRVMVEAPTDAEARAVAEELAAAVRSAAGD